MGKLGMMLRSDGCEISEVKVEPVEMDTCGDDTVKRKRGRPPPKEREAKIEEKDDAGELVKVEIKRKRGRPPKQQANSGSCEKSDCSDVRENGHSDELETDRKKPKRGRPPLQQTFGSQAVNIKFEESCHSRELGSDGEKQKLGTPPILQQSSGSHKKASSDEIRENGDSAKLENVQKKRKRGRPPLLKQRIESQKEVDDVKIAESGHSGQLKNDGSKPRRGRPPKLQKSSGSVNKADGVETGENGGSIGYDGNKPKLKRPKKSKRKPGRPKAAVGHSINDKARKLIICKRGRPPKVNGNDGSCNEEKKEKTGCLVGDRKAFLSTDGSGKSISITTHAEKSLARNKWHEAESVKSIKTSIKKKRKSKKSKTGDEQKRSDMKRALRDRIVELLLAAGWTIQYRPRNKREYNDAVYVNTQGRTHWSVTLAYRKLKRDCEKGNGNPNSTQSGFIFTPIPEEEMSILTRVVTKSRKGKKKSKTQNKDDDTDTVKKGKTKKKKKKMQNEKSNGMTVPGRKHKPQEAQKRKRSSLLVRKSIGAESNGDGYALYDGKRSLLSWMIDLGSLSLDRKVQYVDRRMTQVLKQGKITKHGIQCDCCGEIFAIFDFEIHTGSELNQPLQNICLETGETLLQCLCESWSKQEDCKREGFHFVETNDDDDRNDDTCGICGDGGDLICCDSCPSTFHQTCLGIKKFPPGDWHCIYCTCKFCGKVVDYTRQRRADEDATHSGWCSCCSLCEENYHQSCIQMDDSTSCTPGSSTFCGKKCQELFEKLKGLVGVQNRLPEGFTWTLARRFGCSYTSHGEQASPEVVCNSKLAVALSVMDECFRPLVDHRSGTNLINNIVYNFGSNFKRLDYSGFLTAILERGDEIIAAASIRIHGNEFAEMPFIGTRYTYRRQGMCRRLLNAIESALSYLNVENLIIPAVSELKETWTSVFGFKPLDTTGKQKLRSMNVLVFPGVDMLQKTVSKDQYILEKTDSPKGWNHNENMTCGSLHEEVARSRETVPALFDLNMPDEGTTADVDNDIYGAVSVDSGSPPPPPPPDHGGDSLNSTSVQHTPPDTNEGLAADVDKTTFVCSDPPPPDSDERSVALLHGFDAAVQIQMPEDTEGKEHDPQKSHALELGSHVDKSMPVPLRIGNSNNLGPPVA